MPDPRCCRMNRRAFLGASAIGWMYPGAAAAAAAADSRVAVARCPDYGSALSPSLKTMFDQLGGLGRLVRGKTVAIKINLTGSPTQRLGYTPVEDAQYTHPAVIGAVVRQLGEAGAHRIRVVEGCFQSNEPLEEFMIEAGWDPSLIANAAARVEFENTNFLSKGKRYFPFPVKGGGYIFPGFMTNHSYAETDVIISISKLKQHATCGVTMGMKNMFGCLPLTIYGDQSTKDGDESRTQGGRGYLMHNGVRQPAAIAPPEKDPKTPRNGQYRMPRIVADLAASLPMHLNIIDGIYTMSGGEGPWCGPQVKAIRPGILVAGLNPVSTDAVGCALMGFDPMAARGSKPFERCDNHLELAEKAGVGTRDLNRIEVIGTPIAKARFAF